MKNEVNSGKPRDSGVIPSQVPLMAGKVYRLSRKGVPANIYEVVAGKRLAPLMGDDIVSAIGNNGLSVRSGFLVRIQVPEHRDLLYKMRLAQYATRLAYWGEMGFNEVE